ncbi:Uncharacterised protein [Klebsiella quasipneumoniae]|uniref:hypothetical protein n=1 Tax=Klebsiella quasipneumoniae TaxID=1463165 RepID=UPI0012594DB2|nr:hypothetical protein [Klebsiella quasipneumoniae]MBC4865052.1 hypothetical protein [Klebsiella quasipneumoniae]VAQ00710.1 Uncharacterised protein [Klebsiella quasipneumoniae]VAQ01730.1 Uncharacterised protein [Klebsiella quasipneumoniae]VAQ17732.1 Uncharacterised protein [Klebsiella quasipneumoniae]
MFEKSCYKTSCFDVYKNCVDAINDGELITAVSAGDKEFHFQNWVENRIKDLGYHVEGGGRNTYPDFSLVEMTEGYEVKGLAWPGRERDYDSNSQVPTGLHNGRQIFYIFGRYPADLKDFSANDRGNKQYPVVDLVICHGDFLNSDHTYIHKNKSVKGFGTYGDIMIRDRKMYVAPTPFALVEGTTGLQTLIVPADFPTDNRFQEVGRLVRIEAEEVVIGYHFDLRTNELSADKIPNPKSGQQHEFIAYRLKSQTSRCVSLS